jgi:hypothetical protein
MKRGIFDCGQRLGAGAQVTSWIPASQSPSKTSNIHHFLVRHSYIAVNAAEPERHDAN